MAQCETCGNNYDKAFTVTMNGKSHTFDSFECAIHALAPTCSHCGCRILGHGVEGNGVFFCCAHCAQHGGVEGVDDRSDTSSANPTNSGSA
jgi:Rieske Fe-S protein